MDPELLNAIKDAAGEAGTSFFGVLGAIVLAVVGFLVNVRFPQFWMFLVSGAEKARQAKAEERGEEHDEEPKGDALIRALKTDMNKAHNALSEKTDEILVTVGEIKTDLAVHKSTIDDHTDRITRAENVLMGRS